jgi:hypothetical protein
MTSSRPPQIMKKIRTCRFYEEEQLSSLVKLPIQSRFLSKIQQFLRFEIALNFKRIQTSWKKSQKFSKIMICQAYSNIILDHQTCIENVQVPLHGIMNT